MTPTDARPPAEGGPPAPEAPAPVGPAEPPFPSGAAVREAHAALAGLDPPPAAGAVRRFIARVRATGAGLAARAERVEAQTVINYWANTLVALPVSEARKLSAAETTLDRFDAAAAPDLSDKECPFKGLAAFAESDAGRFFGRDEAIAALVARVAQFPLVLVTGPSGAGKSSLVLAGVLPALAERAVDPKPLVLPVVVPGADPLGALAGAVRSQPRPPGAGGLDSSRLAWSAADFRTALAARAGTRPVVLVLDQFEEVFTLCESREARGAFAAAVAAVAGAPGNRVIVIVREDYLGQALQLDALKPLTADPGARFAPPPMSSRELRRAVERPAELVGLKFDDGIVDELVKEVVGEATALPLLQFALAKVWENKNRNRITWDVYRAVGSPREALKRTADAVYAQLPQDIDRDVTRLVFLDLVRPTAGVEVVRRRVRREVLRRHAAANTVDGVLRRWEAAGLLRETKGTEPADDRFEVAHEALTRNWPLLAGWLEEKRRTAERELQLVSAAKLWADSGRKDGFLLQGAALEEAAGYATASPEVAELVRESRAEQERDSRRKVAIRRRAIIVLSVVCVALAATCIGTWSGWAKASRKSADAKKALTKLGESNDALGVSNAELVGARNKIASDKTRIENAHLLAASSRVVQMMIRAIVAVHTAPDHGPARDDAMRRWDDLIKGLQGEQSKPLASVLKRYEINLDEISNELAGAQKRDLISRGMLSLDLAHRLRNQLLEANDPLIESEFRLRRNQVYNKVRGATQGAVNNLGTSYTAAAPAMREFWGQYWGEMGLFEGVGVTAEMKKFGSQLKVIEERARAALKNEFPKDAGRIDGLDLWRLSRPPAPAPKERELYAPLYEKLSQLPSAATDLEALRKLRESLLEQLEAEEKGPVHPYGEG